LMAWNVTGRSIRSFWMRCRCWRTWKRRWCQFCTPSS
jgi:hypothetical protein